MNKSVGFVIVVGLVVILAVVGYIKNIVAVVNCDFASPYKCEIVHGVGVFVPPVGAIAGWMDLGN
ncbi:MAG: hypothetical protein WC679_01650 [Bacteroidales bacterium]|jgi:hypothetical protein